MLFRSAYVLEGGKRYVVSLTQKDPEKYEGADRLNLLDDVDLKNDIPPNVAG